MLKWLQDLFYVPTALRGLLSSAFGKPGAPLSSALWCPSNQHQTHTHTASVCSCSQEHQEANLYCVHALEKIVSFQSFSRTFSPLNLRPLVRVNSFSDMTRCCPLAPVINGVVPLWLCSREDETCPVLSHPRHMWPLQKVAKPYV